MSNAVVGGTYSQVIDRVIELSENDFLENGVEMSVLGELREKWQERLSRLHVAQMPWDPAPVAPVQPPTVPSNVPKQEESPIQTQTPTPTQQQQPPVQIKTEPGQPANVNYGGNVRIKTEPGTENTTQSYAANTVQYTSGLDRDIAQQRAQDLIRANYGPNAGQYPAMAGRSNIALPGQRPMGLQLPGQGQPQQPRLPNGMQQQQQQRAAGNGYAPHPSQTDGADDALELWNEIVRIKREQGDDGPEGRIVADRMLRQELDAVSRRMESGLMMPLEELKPIKKEKRARKSPVAPGIGEASGSQPIYQLDGPYDDDDDKKDIPDDEAINSDLDDSEDELDKDGDEDEDIGDTMLCTYDKVQRVKNKWKCTLKDGILTTKGKDYLFHKATGEFEW